MLQRADTGIQAGFDIPLNKRHAASELLDAGKLHDKRLIASERLSCLQLL